jgi:hypothetical protein
VVFYPHAAKRICQLGRRVVSGRHFQLPRFWVAAVSLDVYHLLSELLYASHLGDL